MKKHSRRKGTPAIVIFALVLVVVLCWCFLPFDSILAKCSAKREGYDVPSSYSDSTYRYYYENLKSSDEQEAYRYIVAQLPDFPDRIAVPDLSNDQLQAVFQAVSYDNPEFFFLNTECSLKRIGSTYYFIPQYTMSQKEYEADMKKVKAAAQDILDGVPSDGSAYERELYIHDTIGAGTTYDSSEVSGKYNIYGLLVKKQANCEGYSRTMQYLLNQIDIPCRVVSGTADDAGDDGATENHMWNIVTLDGNQYNVDATWDDYVISGSTPSDTTEPSHVYFNMSTADMKKTHTAETGSGWSACTSDDLYYFNVNDLMFSGYESSKTAIRKEIANRLAEGNTTVEFRYTNQNAYEEAIDGLLKNNELYTLIALADYQVSAEHRVSASKIQYTTDPQHNVIRIFLLR